MLVEFGEWLPDLPPLTNRGALEAKNVIPAIKSYRPFKSLATTSTALTARAQGAIAVRKTDGTGWHFAGDATKLYRLAGVTWSDVTRLAGGAYACPSDGWWRFADFGANLIAVNGIDDAQTFDLAAGANFAALGGSPPVMRYVASVRDFVVMARSAAAPMRVQWSGINNSATWATSATTMADQQDLADGGFVMGLVGGEFGLILQEKALRRMTFEGTPTVFRIDKISNEIGCSAEGSVASYQSLAIFWHASGFYIARSASDIQPIGDQKIDRFFASDLDQSYLHRISSAIDPINKVYVIHYPGNGNVSGAPNKALLFNIATNRWSRAEFSAEMIYTGVSQASYTLAGLDAISATLSGLPYALGSTIWTGVARPLLAGFYTDHKQGFFDGSALAATIDTAEVQMAQGKRALVNSFRPMIEGSATVTAQIGGRSSMNDASQFSTAVSVNTHGTVPVRDNERYHRFRVNITGNDWDHAVGVDDIEASPMGSR